MKHCPPDADEQLLRICGPSWSSMSTAQRAAYGPEYKSPATIIPLAAIRDLINLAFQFPLTVRSEGLEILARRWREPEDVCELARALHHDDDDDGVLYLDEGLNVLSETPASSPPPRHTRDPFRHARLSRGATL